MLIKRRRGWELGENQATPESHYLQRRELVSAMGLGAVALTLPSIAWADRTRIPSAALYPAKRNDKYGVPAPMTEERRVTTYNNFYEFGTDKSIYRDAQKLEVRPWTIKVERHGREAVRDRHRRPSGQGAARGARLSPSLRRNLVDDRAVERLSRCARWSSCASPRAAPSTSS